MSGDLDYPALAEELRAAVGDFVRSMRVLDAMPPGQSAVLGHLDRVGELSIADLARREQVRHQSMTRTVNLLRDREFVMIGAAAADRRQVVVGLTDSGGRRLALERRRRAAGIARALDEELDDEEKAIVARIPAILGKLHLQTVAPDGGQNW